MGYDISASNSSGSATGAASFGNVYSGSIGISPWAVVAVVGAVIAGVIGFLLLRGK